MRNKLAFFVLLICAVSFYGCASSQAFKNRAPLKPEEILARYMNRTQNWVSLRAGLKLKVQMGDSSFSAPGHFIYLLGERYEVGFSKPYNRFLGTFYVTPEQIIYWDLNVSPMVFTKQDTVKLSELLPIRVPNWDPRDLLPFPVGGRSVGFQVDSMQSAITMSALYGTSGDAHYVFQMDGQTIVSELVSRPYREPIYKSYSKIKDKNGWPIATRVTCSDSSKSFTMTWKLSNVQLQSPTLR